MKQVAENIIAVRQRDMTQANEAFAHFMSLTEQCLNEKTKHDHTLYKQCSPTELERVALRVLQEVAPQTPFRKEEIKLIAGAKFPDIQAEHYYGIEVKSTKSNSWTSTGSSIFENTRIEDVERIYMLFGKLGGTPAEFRLRPYQDCLSDIALTHAPRYMIDMNIADNEEQPTIFDKFNVDYDSFRLWSEKEKYNKLQQYTIETTPEGKGMPWWIGENATIPMVIRIFNDLPVEEKLPIQAQMFVLFPEIFSNSSSKYKRSALWLCSRKAMVCSCFRDMFSAGGQINEVGGVKFKHRVPKIIENLYDCRQEITAQLSNPTDDFLKDIAMMWHTDQKPTLDGWMNLVQERFDGNIMLSGIKVRELFEKWQ